jgi:RNA polymerase sigma-70 factor (ECF subfamily)
MVAEPRRDPHDAPAPEGAGQGDEELMHAFCRGDARSFEILVARHQRGVFNFLFRSVRNQSRAEELLQEVFLRVVRARSRYEASAKFTTWLYSIARNLCVDESRRAKFRDHQSLDAPRRGNKDGAGSPMVAQLAAEQVPTDEAADAPTIRNRVEAAVQSLPEEQREVFLLRQISGLSFREIADAVGIPENTVKSRMRYALEKLRVELGDLRVMASPEPAREESASHV